MCAMLEVPRIQLVDSLDRLKARYSATALFVVAAAFALPLVVPLFSEHPPLQKLLEVATTLLQMPGIKFTELFEFFKARYSATTLFVVWTMLLQVAASNCSSLPIMAVESFAPQWIARYKIQPHVYQPMPKVVALLKAVFGEQVFGVVFCVALQTFEIPVLERMAERAVNAPLPSFPRLLAELGFNALCFEVVAYIIHRVFHLPRFYKHCHKKHHEFKAPVALSAAHASLVEHFCLQYPVGVLGSVLLHVFANSNVVNFWLWSVCSIAFFNITHSGYYFPWFPLRECILMHEYHHISFKYQLGFLGLMDNLFGTHGGEDYVKWRAANLRRILGKAA